MGRFFWGGGFFSGGERRGFSFQGGGGYLGCSGCWVLGVGGRVSFGFALESPAQRQQRKPPPIPSSHAQQNRQPARAPEVRVHRSPDEVAAAAQQRVQRLEAALQTVGDEDTPEVKSLQDALKKAKVAAQGIPMGVQLEECQKFVARCEKRIAALYVERSRELERRKENQI